MFKEVDGVVKDEGKQPRRRTGVDGLISAELPRPK